MIVKAWLIIRNYPNLFSEVKKLDWIKDFTDKYGKDEDLSKLASSKYHGYVQINFSDGKVGHCNMYQSKQYTITTPNSFSYSSFETNRIKQPK